MNLVYGQNDNYSGTEGVSNNERREYITTCQNNTTVAGWCIRAVGLCSVGLPPPPLQSTSGGKGKSTSGLQKRSSVAATSSRMAQYQGSPSWSNLPPELLGLVYLLLPTRADRVFFCAVCRQWSSAAQECRLPLPSPMPWVVLPTGSVFSFPHGETFHLPEGTRYHNSCGEWIMLSHDDRSCFLMNPFTKSTMPLPSLSSYNHYEEPVEVDEDCIIANHETRGPWMYNMDSEEISVRALTLCSPRLIAAIVAVGDLGTIALCRPGAAAWSVSAYEDCRWLTHMVWFHGKLYVIDVNTEDLLAFHIVDEHNSDGPRLSQVERIIEGDPPLQKCNVIPMQYLLESHGTLLMIRRNLSCSPRSRDTSVAGCSTAEVSVAHGILVAGSSEFEVFVADLENYLWAEVKSLGNDHAFFVGRGCSRAVCVSPYDLSHDCIFFVDDYTDWVWKKTTTTYGVYDMKDRKVYSPSPMVSWKSGDVPATWLFSQGNTDKLLTTMEHSEETVKP